MAKKTEIRDDVKERLKEYIEDDSNMHTSQKAVASRAIDRFLDKLENQSSLRDITEEDN